MHSKPAGDRKCQQKDICSPRIQSQGWQLRAFAWSVHKVLAWIEGPGRYAMESGNKRAIVRCTKQWGGDLKESTIRTWKAKFKELRKRQPTKPLPNRKQGRPLLFGKELDTAAKAYVESIRKLGGVENCNHFTYTGDISKHNCKISTRKSQN